MESPHKQSIKDLFANSASALKVLARHGQEQHNHHLQQQQQTSPNRRTPTPAEPLLDTPNDPNMDHQISIPQQQHQSPSPVGSPNVGARFGGSPMDENAALAAQLASAVPVVDEREERPSLSYKDLIIEAIESSPEKRLKLSEIYQVIRYLHPYYRKRADQWGWQNSIRHNLSLHDSFVKLPLKQTSASGVVGHFWTVVRETEEKPSSSKRRTRNPPSGTGPRLSRSASGKVASSSSSSTKLKGKGRQSVSSDSGVMSSDESANSPSALLLQDGTTMRKDTISIGPHQLNTVASAPHLHRPVPSYVGDLQSTLSADRPSSSNLFAAALAASQPPPAVSTPSQQQQQVQLPPNMLGHYNDLASTLLMSSSLLSRATLNNNNNNPLHTPTTSNNGLEVSTSVAADPALNTIEQLHRLHLLNSGLYQNNFLLQRVMSQTTQMQAIQEQEQQQQLQSANVLLNQLLALKAQLATPVTRLFLPEQQMAPPALPPTTTLQQQQPPLTSDSLQHQLIQLLTQQLLNSGAGQPPSVSLMESTAEVEPTDPTISTPPKDKDLIVG